jgi:hypothetical protein
MSIGRIFLVLRIGNDRVADFGDCFDEQIEILSLAAVIGDGDAQRERVTDHSA